MNKSEHNIQQEIRLALSEYAIVFRINVGTGRTYDGRHFTTGVPKGYSDLSGHRISDGKAFYIECKDYRGRLRPEQKVFLKRMKETGALTGVARSAEDALKIIGVK